MTDPKNMPAIGPKRPFYTRKGLFVSFYRNALEPSDHFGGYLYFPTGNGRCTGIPVDDYPLTLAFQLMDAAEVAPEADPSEWTRAVLSSWRCPHAQAVLEELPPG